MKIRRILPLIPATLLPYLVLALLYLIFGHAPWTNMLMETVFNNNGLLLLAVLLGFAVLSVIISVITFVVSFKSGWDSLFLARAVMIVKLIQIPAYLALFVLGLLFLLTIWTFAFSIIFVIIDCITIFMTGLFGAVSAVLANRQGRWQGSSYIVFAVLSFIFCADVVSSVVFYVKLKKRSAAVTE